MTTTRHETSVTVERPQGTVLAHGQSGQSIYAACSCGWDGGTFASGRMASRRRFTTEAQAAAAAWLHRREATR